MARFFDSLESSLTDINGKLNAQKAQMEQLQEQTLATTIRREMASFQTSVLAKMAAIEQRVAANEAAAVEQGRALGACVDGLASAQVHINRKVEGSHLMKLKGSFESALSQTFQRVRRSWPVHLRARGAATARVEGAPCARAHTLTRISLSPSPSLHLSATLTRPAA